MNEAESNLIIDRHHRQGANGVIHSSAVCVAFCIVIDVRRFFFFFALVATDKADSGHTVESTYTPALFEKAIFFVIGK